MIEKFRNGWLLFKASCSVIAKNKKLLLFPIATFVLTVMMVSFFLTSVALQPTGHSYKEASHWKALGNNLFDERTVTDLSGKTKKELALKPQGWAFAAVLYVICMFLATFFNAAFYHEIFNALRGDPVSLSSGMQFACDRWKPILLWSLFAGAVGLLIQSLEEKVGLFGKLIVRIIGIAWSVASVFAIPIIVHEQEASNPFDVLRRSAGVIKKTWGEQLVGFAGLQFGSTLLFFASLWMLAGFGLAAYEFGRWIILSIGIVAWMGTLFAFAYLSSVAGQVYFFVKDTEATEGKLPENYSPEMLALAWKFKKA